MTVLFRAVRLIEGGVFDVSVRGERIERVTPHDPAVEVQGYDRVIDGTNRLLIPGFFNTHCHAAMTLFRGYGEDLPLQRWLEERIFPAEDRLNYQSVLVGTRLAIAEMLKNGIISGSIDPFRRRICSQNGVLRNDGNSVFTPEEILNITWL